MYMNGMRRTWLVAPVLRGGRGLKPFVGAALSWAPMVAPVLRGGRGLKLQLYGIYRRALGSARPSGRARIET
jgi:hypothetical protein